jgi:DNA-binding NarL/FixJ family response regulator
VNIKVSIIKDDAGLRESLAVLINGSPGFRLVSAHADAEHALQHMPLATPNVALVGINLPKMSGIECVRKLKTVCPALHLMMLTVYDECQKILESLKAGASGYLLMQSTPPAKILEAIKEVFHGGAPMSAEVARLVVNTFHQNTPAHPASEKLTRREEEVLRQIVQGARTKEVADALKIAVPTVQTHLRHIYEKLHARSRSEAVAKYLGGA